MSIDPLKKRKPGTGRAPLSAEFETERLGFSTTSDIAETFRAEAARRFKRNGMSALFRDMVRALLPSGGKRYVLVNPETYERLLAKSQEAGLDPGEFLDRCVDLEAKKSDGAA